MGSGSTLEHHDVSHVGLRRSNNQDARGVVEPWNREQYRRRGWLFVVADGMGAHAAGEMASALAVQEVTGAYEKLVALRSPPLALRASFEDANKKINARGETSPDLRGMGTTCTALALLPRGALVGHVGDSRVYRVRRGTIEQLSRDHSLAWEYEAKAGHDAVLPAGVPKNIIMRSMGPHPQVEVDLEGPFPVEPGDAYVLCSDGLSGQVADEEIGAVAAASRGGNAAAALVGLALVRGAPDNVTVIVARTGEKERSRAAPNDPPWLLEPPDRDPVRRPPLPWRMLAVAAASLLGALICNPSSDIMRATLGADWTDVIGWPCVGLFVLAFIGSLLAAVIGFLTPSGGGFPLPTGHMLGKGPYRSYDCRPTRHLVEGIAASVEAAADGLEGPARQDCIAPLPRARSAAATEDFAAAFVALAEGLAAFRRTVDAGR
ncbi:MAG: protein phosphatase 2C domain-containing protein [Planctomycetaceae bacterium]